MTRLRMKRIQQGLNSGELADAARVSRPFMYDLEKGNRNARLDTWERIAEVLGCGVEAIMEDDQMEKTLGKVCESNGTTE